MKAWLVRNKYEFYAEVVFAETRGKARTLSSAHCERDTRFIDIEAYRQPQADKYYKKGKLRLEWENPKDRIVLVKDCGFYCDDETLEFEDCETCAAKQYCERYIGITHPFD